MKYHRKAILGHFSHGEKFRSKKRSGWFDKTILAAGLLLLTFAAVSIVTKGNTFAEQLSANITVTSFSLTRGGSEITSFDEDHHSTDPEAYTNRMVHNTPTNMDLVLDVKLSGGRTFVAGDTVLVPVEQHSAGIEGTNNDYDLVIDQFSGATLTSGANVIGTFARTDGGILLTFNANAEGLSKLEDLSLAMNNVARSAGIGRNRVGSITIAGQNFYFGIAKLTLANLSDATYSGAVTNNNVLWETRVGSDLTNALSKSRGTSMGSIGTAETYVIQEYPGAIGHGPINIREARRIPVALTGENAIASIRIASEVSRKDKFTEIVPNAGETWNQFLSRVRSRALQYGFYQTSTGLKFVINYGALGVDTAFESAESWAEAAAQSAVDQGYYEASDKTNLINYYIESFGEDSVVQASPSIYYNFRAIYPVAEEDTEVTTTVRVQYDNQAEWSQQKPATLVGIYGRADVPAKAVQVLTVDGKEHTVVAGGLYKLQRKVNGEFEDYTPNDGGELERRAGEDGTILFGELEAGIYRLVELEVPEGYDIKLSNNYDAEAGVAYSDEFTGGSEGVRIIMHNFKDEPAPAPDDDDVPATPDTGVETADKFGSTSDAAIYAMSAFGIAMVVIAIKRKVSID